MRVGELKDLLEDLRAAASDAATKRAVNRILIRIDGHEGMLIPDFFAFLRKQAKPAAKQRQPAASLDAIVSNLRAALSDDRAFDKQYEALVEDKGITKAALCDVYNKLFGAGRRIPSKATRNDILQMIADERTIRVRNEKMGGMLGRRPPVAAE